MSNKTNSFRANNAVVLTDNHDISRKLGSQTMVEKYRDQFTGLALDTGRGLISTIKGNAGDYKVISEDKNLSVVDKALGKRKVLAADIGLALLGGGGTLGLVWLANKIFAAYQLPGGHSRLHGICRRLIFDRSIVLEPGWVY